jgi:hypothetical protein
MLCVIPDSAPPEVGAHVSASGTAATELNPVIIMLWKRG